MKKPFIPLKRFKNKIGLPPGTPIYMGDREKEEIKITVIGSSGQRRKVTTQFLYFC